MRKTRISALSFPASFSSLAVVVSALAISPDVWAQKSETPTPEKKPDQTAQPPEKTAVQAPDKAVPPTGATAAEANKDLKVLGPVDDGQVERAEAAGSEGPVEGEAPDVSPSEEVGSEVDGGGQEESEVEGGFSTGQESNSGAALPEPSSNTAFGAFPNPVPSEAAPSAATSEAPKEVRNDQVFAEEWWSHTRPSLELHGNFRVRPQMYHNFSLNRIDSPASALWPRPLDDYYPDLNGEYHGAQDCTPDEAKTGDSDDPADAKEGCISRTQAGANMRFRIEPTIVISDNLRVSSQIDLLGNLVMGSTAQGSANFPAATGSGYEVSSGSGYRPVSASTNSAASPVSGVNSLQDAISVQRAWAEYETPFGQLKFGRMADHWGLGILRNAGDDIDGDQQSTVDRIAFFTGLPSMDLYVGGAWDFMDEGPTSAGFTVEGGQAYDLSQRDDLSRMNLMIFRRMDAQLERLALAKGKVVANGGLYLSYQYQRLANDVSGAGAICGGENGANALGCQPGEAAGGISRRGFKMVTPDLYGEIKYKKFYAGLEVVTHQGKFDSLAIGTSSVPEGDEDGWRINQWGFAGEIEQRLVEDKLKLGFYFGWASGDGDVNNLIPDQSIQEQIGDDTISTFRFHPGYRVDLILNRHLLSRVQGSYYFKPMAEYDFIRNATGMRVGGRAEAIWTRASNFMQTPGHQRDLGIELNGTVYYQSKDGVQNDRDDLEGGFYSMLQYGVLFPLSGLGYLEDQTADDLGTDELKLKPAQTVRAFLGVAF
jgi:uncharacterized protein (TIGR04551 family)